MFVWKSDVRLGRSSPASEVSCKVWSYHKGKNLKRYDLRLSISSMHIELQCLPWKSFGSAVCVQRIDRLCLLCQNQQIRKHILGTAGIYYISNNLKNKLYNMYILLSALELYNSADQSYLYLTFHFQTAKYIILDAEEEQEVILKLDFFKKVVRISAKQVLFLMGLPPPPPLELYMAAWTF